MTGAELVVPTWRPAKLMESVINKIISDIKFGNEVRKVIQDTLFYGFGILKIGYGIETESRDNIEIPEGADDTPRIREEGVFAARVSPVDFGFDPAATSIEDARYVIHRIVKPIDEVKDNPLYKNTDDIKAQVPEDFKRRLANQKEDVQDQFCTLYEYHDLMDDKIFWMTDDSKKFLRDIDNPHEFRGSHFVMLKFAGDSDEFRGISFISMIEDEAVALNETITKMIRHLDIFPGRVIVEEGGMDEDEMQLWQDGEQGSILPVQNGALREGKVRESGPIPMGGDYFNVSSQLRMLMDNVLGIQDFQRTGITRRKTATEATFEQADSSVRRDYFLGFVKDFVESSVKKIAGLVQQYYDREREVRIEGDTGIDFMKWTKDDIQGEYDFDIDIQSMKFMNQSRVQQLINALNVMASHPELQPILKGLDTDKLAKEIFKQLDLNIEVYKKQPEVAHLEFDPEAENNLARMGKTLPDPKPLEDHDAHIASHSPVYEQTKSHELLRHINMHVFMKKVANGEINVGQLMQQAQSQSQMQPGQQPSGGNGSVPQPNAQPAPTQPELAGNFHTNIPQ